LKRPSFSLRQACIALGFYAIVACIALYNPLFNLSTALTGDPSQPVTTDFYHFHWNFWWIRHASSNGLDVYTSDYVMAPFGSNLALHTLSAFWYPIWAMVEPHFGTVVGMTAVFIVALTLNGFTLYVLARHEGVSSGLALLAGLIWQLSPLIFATLRWTTINLLGWFWLPLIILVWEHVRASIGKPRQRLFWGAMLGTSVWAMVLTDLQHPLFSVFLLVPYGIWSLVQCESHKERVMQLMLVSMAMVIAIFLLWAWGPLTHLVNYDRTGLSATPAERAPSLAFPEAYISHSANGLSIGSIAMPLFLLATAGMIARKYPRGRFSLRGKALFWLALVPVPLILSAGHQIRIGEWQIPMPYVWLHELLGGIFRYPERFSMVFLIPMFIFSMLVLTRYMRLLKLQVRIGLVACLVAIVFADLRVMQSVPLQAIPTDYAVYDVMGSETQSYIIVDVPSGGASGEGIVGESQWLIPQFYALEHGKRVVNGHISRVNTWHYMYMRDSDPMMSWLGQRRLLEAETVETQLRERIWEWQIGYIVIHRQWIPAGATLQEIVGYFNGLDELLCPPMIEHELIVYRTKSHPEGCRQRFPSEISPSEYEIDIGSLGDERFIGWGWHSAEDVFGVSLRWAGEYPEARLFVDLPTAEYRIVVRAQSFWEMRELRLRVNGVMLGEVAQIEVNALGEYAFFLERSVFQGGDGLAIELVYDDAVTPLEAGLGSDTRKLAIAVDSIVFERMPDG
jgi:hypothetical protein